LLTHQGIKDAVVVPREDERAELYLAAYYVSHSRLMVLGLREFLLNVLPDYMVPAYFVQLERIPLTTTGKVDRRALPAPESPGGAGYVTASEPQKKLAEIWGVLGIDSLPGAVGIDENFSNRAGIR
jgi:acyl-coenzyme A synthetase/AMP-(fatty) acid ligase